MKLAEHQRYLRDVHRIAAYRQALGRVVREGDRVLDLGCGTGVLGCLACEAGAGVVHAVDEGPMIEIARGTARAGGFEQQMTFHRCKSSDLRLAERVDVVVADQLAPFAVGAGVIESYADARERLLREGGALVPSSVELWVAPVEDPSHRSSIDFWSQRPAGLDLSHVHPLAIDTAYWLRLEASQLLGPGSALATVDLRVARDETFVRACTAVVERQGTMHGLGGWFVATLADDVSMTSSPLAADRIDRENILFPLERAVEVVPGDRVDVTMRISPREPLYTWTVEVSGPDGRKARCLQSTARGMLVSREDLEQSHPGYVPRLSERGEAHRTVIDLVNGRTTRVQIEDELLRRHGNLFPSRAAAAGFLARLLGMMGR